MWHRAATATILIGLGAAVPAAPPAERPIDAWHHFDTRSALQCPGVGLAHRPPGDIDYLEEGFVPTLTAGQSRALKAAIPRVDDGPRACAGRNGIACPAAWTMVAIEKAGLLPRFVRYACAHGNQIP